MGEEVKKPEEQKAEEKKTEEPEKHKEEEAKTSEEVQKDEKKKRDESKEGEVVVVAAPPPQDIILRVYVHCEGCATKVRRCLEGFEGVEEVETDCKSHKVVVKGDKADPRKVVARVQRKSHRQVELISPIPPPLPPEDPQKPPPEKETPKPQEKKEEAQVITVVLKVYMHCEACAQEIKKRIQRMKGVESAEPDLKASEVTVKGVFEASKLVEYVYKRTGKHAVVVKQDPEPQKKEKDKKKSGEEGGDKKDEAKGGDMVAEGGNEGDNKKEGGGGGGGGGDGEEAVKPEGVTADQLETNVLELKKNDFYYYYPQNYQIYPPLPATEMYSYSYVPPAPQMFSDENPNACSIM